ncbi:MAG: phosphoribosyl-AMP cyclohydrolase [Phycisphaerales bacterium]|nr:phosphoribosyl-AMP cyclohydrolase [Phycisphaerales bacterium]
MTTVARENGTVLDLKFDANGLITAVAVDADNGEVLMVAFMNREALERTLQTRKATYWSRSRSKFWVKGEESGHVQEVQDILIDCDQDCVLLKVRQKGVACHTGRRSCFYRSVLAMSGPESLKIIAEPLVDTKAVYASKK